MKTGLEGIPFGKFVLLRKIGTGGMAELFLARQAGIEGFEKLVVIKRILAHLADSQEFLRMFLDEARLAARLNHPNIVQIYDLGRVEDRYFIAMEYVNGFDVNRILKRERNRGGRIPVGHAVKIMSYVCEGLTYAHSLRDTAGRPLNIVHRDISPHNILVALDGGVKITDFGIAKAAGHFTQTRHGTIKGKIGYMSPEQCLGKPVDNRSDIFSAGILLYQLATGVHPFSQTSDFSTMQAIVQEAPPPPTAVCSDFPPGLLPVLDRALAKHPDDRFPDALALQMALENFLMEAKIVTNTTLIGQYLRGLFPELSTAEESASGRETASMLVILGSAEVGRAQEAETEDTEALALETVPDKTATSPFAQPAVAKQEGSDSLLAQDTYLMVTPSQFIKAEPIGPKIPLFPERFAASFKKKPAVWLGTFGLVFAVLLVWLTWPAREPVPAVASPVAATPAIDTTTSPAPKTDIDPLPTGQPAASALPEITKSVPETGDADRPIEKSAPNASISKPSSPRSASLPRPVQKGYMTIDAQPWAEVWFQGKKLGLTPLAYLEMPAGKQKILLRNPDRKLEKQVWIMISPGKTTALKINLSADAP